MKALPKLEQSIFGCLLGGALGDAVGLASEGLSRRRLEKIFGKVDSYHFFFGRGMASDDTEHALMTAQALIGSGGDVDEFRRLLAWKLRFWLLGLPAGIGLATLRSLIKLWFGVRKSGVFSAGNGPAMRSAILGVCYGGDEKHLERLVRVSTELTHTDPKAFAGACAISIAAHLASRHQAEELLGERLLERLASQPHFATEHAELLGLLKAAIESAKAGQETAQFADAIGLKQGVSGYMYHTVPVALQAWLRYPGNFRAAVEAVIACGGDTDSTAAIVGGVVGAGVGVDSFPAGWLAGYMEYPRSRNWILQVSERLATSVADGRPAKMLALSIPAVLMRNIFFLCVVLAHGLRRLLPPY